jgi:hypothetical protein
MEDKERLKEAGFMEMTWNKIICLSQSLKILIRMQQDILQNFLKLDKNCNNTMRFKTYSANDLDKLGAINERVLI